MFYQTSFAETYACGDFVIKRQGNKFIQYSKVTNNSNVYSIISEDDLYMHMVDKSFYRVTIVAIDKKKKLYTLTISEPNPKPSGTLLKEVQLGGSCAVIP